MATHPETVPVNHLPWYAWLALTPLALLFRLWAATLRLRLDPEDAARMADTSTPRVLLIWHNRIFIVGALYRRYRRSRRLACLVSASKDGAWLTAFFRLNGIATIRGSSSKRGIASAREAVRRIHRGDDIGITPDGPRGPLYTFAPGAVLVTRATNSPVLAISCRFTRAWRINSWDGFYLPRPFSTVHVHTRAFPDFDAIGPANESRATTAARLRDALMAMTTDTADPPRVRRASGPGDDPQPQEKPG